MWLLTREPGGRANFGRRLSQSVLPAAWNHRPTCTLTTCSFASCSTRGFSSLSRQKRKQGKKRAKCRVEWRRHVVSTPAIRLDGIPRTFVSLSLGLGLVHGQNLHDPTFGLPAADHRHRRLLVAYTTARQALIETRSDDAPGYKYSYSQIELVTVSARVGRWAGMASDGPGAGRGYSTTSSSELRTRSTRKEGGRDGLAAPATDRQTSQWRRCHRPPSCPHRTPPLHGSQSAVVEVSLVCVSSVLRCFALLAVVAHEARVSLVVRPSGRRPPASRSQPYAHLPSSSFPLVPPFLCPGPACLDPDDVLHFYYRWSHRREHSSSYFSFVRLFAGRVRGAASSPTSKSLFENHRTSLDLQINSPLLDSRDPSEVCAQSSPIPDRICDMADRAPFYYRTNSGSSTTDLDLEPPRTRIAVAVSPSCPLQLRLGTF